MDDTLQKVSDAGQGLALEAQSFAATGQTVGLWHAAKPALVAPKTFRNKPGFEEAARRSADRGWPVFLRPSGGGTVPQGPGVLNLVMALTVPQSLGIHDGYRLLCDPVIAFGRSLGLELSPGATPHSFCDGDWNLSWNGRKIVGTAQRLRPLKQEQFRMLAHALILVDGPVAAKAEAVDAFHRDLGLDPVRAEVHTSLQGACDGRAIDQQDMAQALKAYSMDAIAATLGDLLG